MSANRSDAHPINRPVLYFSTGIFPSPTGDRYDCSPGLPPTPRNASDQDSGWSDLDALLATARLEVEADLLFELGVDEFPPPILDIRGRIENQPERVFAWIDCDGEARYFGVSALPVARIQLPAAPSPKTRRTERHYHSGCHGCHGYTFDYGFLAEDFDSCQLSESNGYYRLSVEVESRNPLPGEDVQTWSLTIPANLLTPRRRARLRPLAEVLFVSHLFYPDPDPSDDDLDLNSIVVQGDGLRAHVVRFAVVTASRRARTRYVRYWITIKD